MELCAGLACVKCEALQVGDLLLKVQRVKRVSVDGDGEKTITLEATDITLHASSSEVRSAPVAS